MIGTAAIILAVLVWLVAIVWAFDRAMGLSGDLSVRHRVMWGGLAVAIFVGGVTPVLHSMQREDPRLCQRGHQEYQRVPTLVGKMVVPVTRKVWVCEMWAPE